MNETLTVSETPMKPPTEFEPVIKQTVHDTWKGEELDILSTPFGFGFSEMRPSSSHQEKVENLPQILLAFSASTTSQTIFAVLVDLFQTKPHSALVEGKCPTENVFELRPASVEEKYATENVFELRRLTGFTWKRLADLLNVDRRTLHNWVKGSKIRKDNRERIAKTLSVLRFADRGSAEENAAAIAAEYSSAKMTPFEAIKAGLYDNARQCLSHGSSRSQLTMLASDWTSWTGEFQPMAMHEDAYGYETIEALPDEPKPASRKRCIKRG